jgi:CRP-like cAMP-binding protein
MTKDSLKDCSVFSALNGLELQRVSDLVKQKHFDVGSVMFEEGDDAGELFVLQEGKVALQMLLPKVNGQTGRKITVDVVNYREVVGWSALVEPFKYPFRAICLQNVEALSLGGDRLRLLLREEPKIGYKVLNELIKAVATRLHETSRVLITERALA